MEALLRAISDPVIAVDLRGVVTFANAAAAAVGATVGRPLEDALEVPWRQVIEDGVTVASPEVLVGARIIAETTSPIRDVAGAIVGALAILRDLTEHRVAARHFEIAERFNQLGTLAAVLAHQVNNPLAVILVHAELLRDELGALRDRHPGEIEHITEMLDSQTELERAVQSIARITADLRSFSAPVPSSHEADIRRSIEWAARTASPRLRDRARAITKIELEGPVALDEPRFGQLLVNLIRNAAHSIAPGAAERNEIAITARPGEPGMVVIEVRDTGTGIPLTSSARNFEPTFTTTQRGISIGLGLAICHSITHSVGGAITIDSTPGVGTTVRIALPLARPDPAMASDQRARILIVDNDEAYVQTVQHTLRDHEVTCCTTAGDALVAIGRGITYDVILADVELAGTELYEHLLVDHPGIARRIVFVARPLQRSEFLATTPNRWIEKTLPAAELRAVVQSFVARA